MRLPRQLSAQNAARCQAGWFDASGAKRQPKNPKDFKSMDELRASLHNRSGLDAGLSGFLNWVSQEAFGAGRAQGHTGEGLRAQDIASLPELYRRLLEMPWAQALDSGLSRRPGYVPAPAERWGSRRRHKDTLADIKLTDVEKGQLRLLQTVLICSEASVVRMARRFPAVLCMDPADILQRLLLLKGILPGCDVLLMVETAPQLLLSGEPAAITQQVGAAAHVLREGLEGANLQRMFEDDPAILFEPPASLQAGVAQLRDLWDMDEAALRNSELALAVKALSPRGPPASF